MKAFTILSSIVAIAAVAVASEAPVAQEIAARSPFERSQYSTHFKRASGSKSKKIGGGGGGGDDDEEDGQNNTAISVTASWKWMGAGVVLTGVALNL